MRHILYYAVFLVGSTTLCAQSDLQTRIDRWAADEYFKYASVGVCVTAVETGDVVASYDAERSLIPASNLKLLTTATALAVLGPDFRFETQLAYDGYIDAQGVLNGNLFIVGSGDPTLGSPEMVGTPSRASILERWRMAVQQVGIRQVAGRVVADATAFSTAANGSHWQWLDMGNYYGCGAFGLNFHDNLYYLRFQQRAEMEMTPPVVEVTPTVPGLQFTNEVITAARGSGDNAYIYGAPYTYRRYLRGTIPQGSGRFTIKGSIPDPPLFVAQQLTDALASVGILCLQPPTAQVAADRTSNLTVLHRHESPTLAAIVERINMRSVNMYAECLLRAIGKAQLEEGSEAAGIQAMYDYWRAEGLDSGGVQLYDGSGMSPRNVLPARFFCDVLVSVYQNAEIKDAFWNSIPVAGQSGSMRNSLRDTSAAGNLRAKTGSLEQVRAYTGYVTDGRGRLLAFSVLLNNYDDESGPARRKLLALLADLAR